MKFLHFFVWWNRANYVGIVGPYDAFFSHYNCYPQDLAIDQGTIALMIEKIIEQDYYGISHAGLWSKMGLKTLGFHLQYNL
jgi:hypothetical protein